MLNNRCPIKNTRIRSTLLGVFCMFYMTSCNNTAILDQDATITNRRWLYNEQPIFQVKIPDNTVRYDIYLSLRHSLNYRFSNIFLLLKETTPNNKHKTSRIEIKLAEPDGRWLGNGSGSIYSHQVRVSSNYLYPDTGTYSYQIEQNMRVNPLLEVVDVGIRIVPSTN